MLPQSVHLPTVAGPAQRVPPARGSQTRGGTRGEARRGEMAPDVLLRAGDGGFPTKRVLAPMATSSADTKTLGVQPCASLIVSVLPFSGATQLKTHQGGSRCVWLLQHPWMTGAVHPCSPTQKGKSLTLSNAFLSRDADPGLGLRGKTTLEPHTPLWGRSGSQRIDPPSTHCVFVPLLLLSSSACSFLQHPRAVLTFTRRAACLQETA